MLETVCYASAAFISLALFLTAIVAGTIIERNHLGQLDRREEALRGKLLIHNRKRVMLSTPSRCQMVVGEAVIGADRFKTWLARWRQLVGGRMGSLEPVVERARREALLRAAEKAYAAGYTELANVRFSMVSFKVGDQRQRELMVGVQAYGTAFAP